MVKRDVTQKLQRGREKIRGALEENQNFAVMATGITADDCRIALAAVNAGVRIIEVNHPSVSLSIGLQGVTTMREAEDIRYQLPRIEIYRKIEALRRVLGDGVYISAAVTGLFTEAVPSDLTPEDYCRLAGAGADGLHVHKATFEDLTAVVNGAHGEGLLVDAYISDSNDEDRLGIPADSDEAVRDTAIRMEQMGVDFVGLIMGQSFKGERSGRFSEKALRRLKAVAESVTVPVFAEGGVTEHNIDQILDAGAQVAVVGTFIDDLLKKNIGDAVRRLSPAKTNT
ncbi:MAG: thiamine phosphate synthase [Desulfobacterales bacterium]|nr:MAG: thiamine phosphate synthase [Desulfobacterales bacterium]